MVVLFGDDVGVGCKMGPKMGPKNREKWSSGMGVLQN